MIQKISPTNKQMEPYFQAAGLMILDELMKLDPDQGLAIKGDGHSSGKARQIVAQHIVADFGLGGQPA